MGGVFDSLAFRQASCLLDRRSVGGDADVSVSAALREFRTRLLETVASHCGPAGCGECSAPQPCAGHQAIDEVLKVIPGAETYVLETLGRAGQDGSTRALVSAVTRDLCGVETPAELFAAIPQVAIAVCHGAAAALLRVREDGAVETLSRGEAPFEAQPWRLADLAREAIRVSAEGRNGHPGDGERPVRRAGRLSVVPLSHGPEGLVLALERAASKKGGALGEREDEALAVFAALAHGALTGARAHAALRDVSARDAATLGAIRDGVIAVDREGVVRALNDAAAAALGARRDDLLGRRLSEVPRLAALAVALSGPAGQVTNVTGLPRGDVAVRPQAYEGGVVATLNHLATEQTIARRITGSVARYTFQHLLGASSGFLAVLDEARRAATSDVPVLVCGESGTGKEMLAQAIHNASSRASEPFLGINVTAIPRELLESELFGYEGGSFTGARNSGRAGKFELTGGGTLLLDEIGDMPLEMQGKLLRVLQERIVQRLGSARDIQVKARIIATTSRDLGEAVEQGRFRLDLYHRLRVLQLRLPPLRERKGDVPLVVAGELRSHADRTQRRIAVAPHVMAALEKHDWPGNVRELRNVIEGEISVLAPGDHTLTRIPPVLGQPRRLPRPAAAEAPEILPLVELERQACERALAACQWNVARAARALGVAKGTLYSKMKLYGIVQHAPSPAAPGQVGACRQEDL